jgi:hypothetical protein
MKRLLISVAVACFALTTAAPTFAADHGGAKKEAPKKPPPPPKKPAASGDGGENEKVGGATTAIQLMPMMAPYRTAAGQLRYELLSVRIELAPDSPSNDKLQRGACFMVPIVHEKMLLWLATAKLQAADFKDQRREVLAKNLLNVAVAATDKNYFTGLKLVDASAPPLKEVGSDAQIVDSDPPLSQRSQTLTAQCK